jgi:hypothetical protein
MIRKILFISLMSFSFLGVLLTSPQAAEVVPMQNANDYSVAVKTDRDVYKVGTPIKIYVEITNTNNNKIIDFTKVFSYFRVTNLNDPKALEDQSRIWNAIEYGTGLALFDIGGQTINFSAYPHSTRLGFIGIFVPGQKAVNSAPPGGGYQWTKVGLPKLPPGKYVVRVKFADNIYDAVPYVDSQKIITIQP